MVSSQPVGVGQVQQFVKRRSQKERLSRWLLIGLARGNLGEAIVTQEH